MIPIRQWAVSGSLWIVNYFFYALAYYYFRSAFKNQKKVGEYERAKLQEDKRRLELEVALLRAQINPHFLYNTLSFLYAKSLPLSPDLSDGIIKLSDIMRYSLDNQDFDRLAALSDEVEHVMNVIDLARLRFGKQMHLVVQIDTFDDDVLIAPLLFLTLVENIFKHGELNDPAQPARIILERTGNDRMSFFVSNKKRHVPTAAGSGIGLANTRARLADLYGEQFEMHVADKESVFEVTIILPLIGTQQNTAAGTDYTMAYGAAAV